MERLVTLVADGEERRELRYGCYIYEARKFRNLYVPELVSIL